MFHSLTVSCSEKTENFSSLAPGSGRTGLSLRGFDKPDEASRMEKCMARYEDSDLEREKKGYIWSGKRDSNPQPSAWKADALAVELFPHHAKAEANPCTVVLDSCLLQSRRVAKYSHSCCDTLVEGGGFEPPKSNDDRFTVCSLWPLGNPSRDCYSLPGAGDGT